MNKKERNLGIELLRIVAMLGIMVLHVLGQGGVLSHVIPLGRNYEAAWALEVLCYSGVTIYALISGYVSLEGRYRITNIVYLYLQVLFYNLIAFVGFALWAQKFSVADGLRTVLLPVSTECYWYFSAYFPLFFLIPLIKLGFEKLPKLMLDAILLMIVILWTILPIFIHTDVFGLRSGCSFIWLSACFYVGAYMKHFGVFESSKGWILWIIFALSLSLTFASKLAIELVFGISEANPDKGSILIAYNSPTILLASMTLLILFSRFNINMKAAKFVKLIASFSFGVYLSNCQPFVWNTLMKDRFVLLADAPTLLMLLKVVLAALTIFLVGIAIDGLRYLFFELLKLRKRLDALENALNARFLSR